MDWEALFLYTSNILLKYWANSFSDLFGVYLIVLNFSLFTNITSTKTSKYVFIPNISSGIST